MKYNVIFFCLILVGVNLSAVTTRKQNLVLKQVERAYSPELPNNVIDDVAPQQLDVVTRVVRPRTNRIVQEVVQVVTQNLLPQTQVVQTEMRSRSRFLSTLLRRNIRNRPVENQDMFAQLEELSQDVPEDFNSRSSYDDSSNAPSDFIRAFSCSTTGSSTTNPFNRQ